MTTVTGGWAIGQRPETQSQKLVLVLIAIRAKTDGSVPADVATRVAAAAMLTTDETKREVLSLVEQGCLEAREDGGYFVPMPAPRPKARRTYGRSAQAPAGRRARVMIRDGGLCHYCGGDAETVDHAIPMSRGGTHDEANLVACCKGCNASKGGRLPDEWPQNPARAA